MTWLVFMQNLKIVICIFSQVYTKCPVLESTLRGAREQLNSPCVLQYCPASSGMSFSLGEKGNFILFVYKMAAIFWVWSSITDPPAKVTCTKWVHLLDVLVLLFLLLSNLLWALQLSSGCTRVVRISWHWNCCILSFSYGPRSTRSSRNVLMLSMEQLPHLY